MKHFQPLDRCECGAYRYLAAREHGRSFEVVLIHQMPDGKRTYRKVTSFQKAVLVWHDPRNRGLQEGDALVKSLSQIRGQLSRVITELESRDKEAGKE